MDFTDDLEEALVFAVNRGRNDEVEELLRRGAPLGPDDGVAHLVSAIRMNNVRLIRLLLDAGVPLNRHDGAEKTPLHYATAARTAPEVVRLLIAAGAALDAVDVHQETPLILAVRRSTPAVVAQLLRGAQDLNYSTGAWSAMSTAIARGSLVLVRMLLDAGAGMKATAGQQPPLFLAAAVGNLPIVQLLLARGANPDARTDFGTTPLYAVAEGCARGDDPVGVAMALLDAGASINRRGLEGETALEAASACPDSSLAQLLLARGADVSAADEDGYTPLHRAALAGNARTVQLLLGYGADPNAETSRGMRPIDLARMNMRQAAAEVLARAT